MLVLKKFIILGLLSVCDVSFSVETTAVAINNSLNIKDISDDISFINIIQNRKNKTGNTIPNKIKKKRKRLGASKYLSNSRSVLSDSVNVTESTAFSKRPQRKRKLRKRRKKQKSTTRIMEVTTETGIIFSSRTESNVTLKTLIDKPDKNPEGHSDEFKSSKIFHSVPNKTELVISHNVTNNIEKQHEKIFKYNRCRKNRGGCGHICNPKGTMKCSCLKGFYLGSNKRSCFDLDECQINNGGCGDDAECVNLIGSYVCKCPAGLTLADDRKTCRDINECFLRNGHGPCQDTCENTFGSYKCSCERLKGTIIGSDGHTCEDLNECAIGNGGCSHNCINALGRSFCSCPVGMELSSDWKTCQDIDECELLEDVQNTCKNCLNTAGSFICLDTFEMQNDQPVNTVCQTLFPPSIGFISCTNDGAVQSFTKKGRKRITNSPGTVCRLICPAGYRMIGEYNMICGSSGDWEGNHTGKCIDAVPPILKCPPSQHLLVDNEFSKVHVEFSSPITDVGWKYVTGFPTWAKELEGTLTAGEHVIAFTVKDPTTELFSSCYFKIIVEVNKNCS